MKKFETLEDLAKATGQLAGYFTKNLAFHKAAQAEHASQQTQHDSQAAFYKAAHDAMDDGHERKAQVGKAHEYHVAQAAYHKTMAGQHAAQLEEVTKLAATFGEAAPIQKSDPAPAPADGAAIPTGVEGMIAKTVEAILSKSLSTVETSGKVEEMVERMVVERVNKALGNQVVPDGVRSIFEQTNPNSPDGLRLVNRAGGPPVEKAKVSAEMDEALAL